MPDRLYRSRRERMIGGVAGGIAENLRIDPTIVRIGWVVLALLTNGMLVLVYFLLLFLLPEAPEDAEGTATTATTAMSATTATTAAESPPPQSTPPRPRPFGITADGRSGALVVGAILVLAGGYFLVRQYLPSIDLRVSWPFVAIAVGVVLIVAAFRPGGRSG